MKISSSICNLVQLFLGLCLTTCVLQAQAQARIELDSLSWFDNNNFAPGSYTKPGSPSETLVNTIPIGGPPAVFCNPSFPGANNNGQTMIGGSVGKGGIETLNDYGGTFSVTRKYLVTPGRATYMKVRMTSAWQSNLLVSSITATIDGHSLGTVNRYNSRYETSDYVESSYLWTPASSLVNFVISVTMPGSCAADELILIVDEFYQEASTIHAIDDNGTPVDSNGGQSLANVLANDLLGNATPTLNTVNLTQVSSTDPNITLDTSTGAVNVAPTTTPGNYSLVYRICEKANPGNCSQATVTLRVTLAPAAIIIKKALAGGGRIKPADQFTVQVRNAIGAINSTANSTTKGSGSAVDAGSGTTGSVIVEAETAYNFGELMAPGSVSSLSNYSTTVSCQTIGLNGSDATYSISLNDFIYSEYGDTTVCTITNSSPSASLTLKQVIAPGSGQSPFNFNYTVGNGWGNASISNPATGAPGVTSGPRNLTAGGIATPIMLDLPSGWRIVPEASSCVDSNGVATGNGSGSFGTQAGNALTVPAGNVRSGSALVCTLTLGLTVSSTTLTLRQVVLNPLPPNLSLPFQFSYTGNNGWSAPPLSSTAMNQYVSTTAIALAAINTDTTLQIALPEPHWLVAGFHCADTTTAASGNPTGDLVTSTSTSITIPANRVLTGANLLCSVALGHWTP